MKFPKTQGLVALLCVLAAPLAHATSAVLKVESSLLSLKAYTTPAATSSLSWAGYGAGAITQAGATAAQDTMSAVVASGSGATASASSTDVFTFLVTAGTIYKLSLPYTYTVDATNANDGEFSLSLSMALAGGSSSVVFSKAGGQGAALAGGGTLSYLFRATQTGSATVNLLSAVSSSAALVPGAVTPVPEAGAGSMALAGLGVLGLLALRRRQG